MNIQDIKNKLANKEHFNYHEFAEAVKTNIDTVRFIVPLNKIMFAIGGIGLADGNSHDLVECFVSEERYELKENYKITVIPVDTVPYGKEHFYLMDFVSLIEQGTIKIV